MLKQPSQKPLRADARRNLRRELHRMREAGMEDLLDSSGRTLALRSGVDLDTAAFHRASAPIVENTVPRDDDGIVVRLPSVDRVTVSL